MTGECDSDQGQCARKSEAGRLSDAAPVKIFSRGANAWIDGKMVGFEDDGFVRIEYGVGNQWYGKSVHVKSDCLRIEGRPSSVRQSRIQESGYETTTVAVLPKLLEVEPLASTDDRQKQLQEWVQHWKLSESHIFDWGRRIELMQAQERADLWWRQRVLLDTLDMLKTPDRRAAKLEQAMGNLETWNCQRRAKSLPGHVDVSVLEGDWGEVAISLTKKYGCMFAVLNMAHAQCPGGGGGYVHGTAAQEENMFRRTDCHFGLDRKECMRITKEKFMSVLPGDYMYTDFETRHLNARYGMAHLDIEKPRVCFRGKEVDAKCESGYEVMPASEWFPFYEMKAAAVDLRVDENGEKRTPAEMVAAFDPDEMRRRVQAQFQSLVQGKIRHVVLSAFGCGAFGNPPQGVAEVYAEVIPEFAASFEAITFAIYYPGYGPRDNYDIFSGALKQLDGTSSAPRTCDGEIRKLHVQSFTSLSSL